MLVMNPPLPQAMVVGLLNPDQNAQAAWRESLLWQRAYTGRTLRLFSESDTLCTIHD